MYEYWNEHWGNGKINPYVNFILKCRETINITNTFNIIIPPCPYYITYSFISK